MPATLDPAAPFRWSDGDRVIRFGRGAAAEARDLLDGPYVLLTTERARDSVPGLAEGASAVHEVAPGPVDEVSAALRDAVDGELLVALGGGRVVDVAKALAAADPPRRVASIPTTLSAAEMTSLHRHVAGVTGRPGVRAELVVNDPALSASQPEPALAASALNALAHAIEAPLTVLANPVATLAAHEGARLIARAWDGDEPDRDALALGALLAGYAAGSAIYGLHHVMAQTAVRVARIGHGPSNAILLPHTTRALARRFPAEVEALGQAMDEDVPSAAARICAITGTIRLRELGVSAETLAECAEAASGRGELSLTPPPADHAELAALYEEAW
jgi:alcohol dehydrogenase class IV